MHDRKRRWLAGKLAGAHRREKRTREHFGKGHTSKSMPPPTGLFRTPFCEREIGQAGMSARELRFSFTVPTRKTSGSCLLTK